MNLRVLTERFPDAAKPQTVERWERDHPHDATPRCSECSRLLGVRRFMFSASGRDVWLCDNCDKEFSHA